MGLFRKRKSRATRRAEARAIKARAKLEAKLAAKNEARRHQGRPARRRKGPQGADQIAAGQRPDGVESRRGRAQGGTGGQVAVADADPPGADGVSAARADPDAVDLPGGHGRARADRPASRGSTRHSVGSDRPVLRARRPAVGPDRRGGEVVADGAGQEAQGRRDQAVRRPPSPSGSPICRRPSPPRRTCRPRGAGRPTPRSRRSSTASRRT